MAMLRAWAFELTFNHRVLLLADMGPVWDVADLGHGMTTNAPPTSRL